MSIPIDNALQVTYQPAILSSMCVREKELGSDSALCTLASPIFPVCRLEGLLLTKMESNISKYIFISV